MATQIIESEDQFRAWRGKILDPKRHGGIGAASLACVVEVLENMVFLCNASNFMTYFSRSMHYSIPTAANMVTNFAGTSFLLTLFAGFICDSFLTRFTTFILFCSLELLGIVLLTIQAQTPRLQPAIGNTPSPSQAALLYTGLYAMATGVGGVKASLPAHGADQLDRSNQRLISSFFNWFFFGLCIGGLLSSTVMVWIEENKGWTWSFKISAVALSLALCIFAAGFPIYRFKLPSGSPLTRIYKVVAAAVRNRGHSVADGESPNAFSPITRVQKKFRFFDRALVDDNISENDVEETRTFIGLLPIFASTILMNCCLAQLQTFSIQQGSQMNRKLSHNFTIPTQSLTAIPLIIMLSSIPLYEHVVNMFGNRVSSKFNVFKPLKRIGLGLMLASVAMAVAAGVEEKRRRAATGDSEEKLSVFWLGWQYLLLGVSDMLTLGGMLEFFYSEAPASMRSMSTSLSWVSTSMGFFLSSILVSIANLVSGRYGKEWLGGSDLNHDRLDLFYTLLCLLNFLNFFNYIIWAKRY